MNYLITIGNKNFTIRKATNSDTEQIVELVKKILPEFNFVYSPESSEKDLLNIEDTYTNNGGTFEVIENENAQIMGTAALLKLNDKTSKLRKMYLAKSYRGLGLGNVMLERMLYNAKELQFDEIILETVHSMKEAVRLYEKYGFEQVGSENTDSPRCNVIMKRKVINPFIKPIVQASL